MPLLRQEQIAAQDNDSLEELQQGLPGFVDPDEVRTEWLSLKTAMQNHPTLNNAESVLALVQELSKNHSEEYPVLRKLADWGLAISLPTADAEQDFSLLKLGKSARRSRVSNVTLQHIMAIKIDAPPMEEFPFEEALASWHSTKMRRTMTAKPTENEKTEREAEVKEAEQEKQTAPSAVPSSNSSLGQGQPLQSLAPYGAAATEQQCGSLIQ